MPLFILIAAMAAVLLASNILVQFPVTGAVGELVFRDILTWGAFIYPVTFLITDLTNRVYGPNVTRTVVFSGFIVAIIASVMVPPVLYNLGLIGFETDTGRLQRVAIASGLAFLCGQLLDIALFNRLRAASWWQAPIIGSIVGSAVDTILFFSLAFAAFFVMLGPIDDFASQTTPLLGIYQPDLPRWMSWALGDFIVKILFAFIALVPYRLLMSRFGLWQTPVKT